MRNEKIVAISIVVAIVVILSTLIVVTNEEVFKGIFPSAVKTVEEGDCVEVHYIGRYASNGTVFDSSYSDYENKTGGTPLKIYLSLTHEDPPKGYEGYSSDFVIGFIEGLLGSKEGDIINITVPPEKGYGIKIKIGDKIDVSNQSAMIDLHWEIIDIKENSPVPEEFKDYIGEENTTIYTVKDNSYYIGQKHTLYPCWENATVVVDMNETTVWFETTPPEDKMYNFTWIEYNDYGFENQYWENASSVTTINNTTIVITHTPQINQTMEIFYGWETINCTVVNVSEEKINCSYVSADGNLSYLEFNRTIVINRTENMSRVRELPKEIMEYFVELLKDIDPTIPYSLHELAGETLIFEVEVIKVHKTS